MEKQWEGHHFFFAAALTFAHRARRAAAIRAFASALMCRRLRPVAVTPVPFRIALARWSLLICSSSDWIICSMLMSGHSKGQ